MAKVTLLAHAKVQGKRYKKGDEVDVKKKELLDELAEKGLIVQPKPTKLTAADTEKQGGE